MSIFSKLKSNVDKKGIKLEIVCADDVSGEEDIPVTVKLTATKESATVKGVKVELVTTEAGYQDSATAGYTTHLQTEIKESFTLQPGETKSIDLKLELRPTTGSETVNKLVGIIGGIDKYKHFFYVRANVDIEGVTADASERKRIQVDNDSRLI